MINLFLGIYQPNRSIAEIGGVQDRILFQKIQEYPPLELKLHSAEAIA